MVTGLQSNIAEGLLEPTYSVGLVRKAQAGDSAALDELFDRYHDRVRRIVRIRLRQKYTDLLWRMESVDIVHDAYQVAWRKLSEFEPRGPGSILNWLARIAENQIRDARAYLHAGVRDVRREVPLEPPEGASRSRAAERSAEITRPDERAARAEIREIVDDALSELSDEHREVILLRDYCGGEWQELAETLQRSVGATQALHRRAWIRLRTIVRPRLGER